MIVSDLQEIIEHAFEQRDSISPSSTKASLLEAIGETIDQLDRGQQRVAEKIDGKWQVNEWLKKAVLLYFRTHDNDVVPGDAFFRQGAAEIRALFH